MILPLFNGQISILAIRCWRYKDHFKIGTSFFGCQLDKAKKSREKNVIFELKKTKNFIIFEQNLYHTVFIFKIALVRIERSHVF
jgi:hypothetical protein